MKLSVIVANYNNEDYIQDCLDSIISQTYQPFEVIIADDSSTDKSVPIIKKYENKYGFIKGIYNQINLGVALNRHNAIMKSKGDYITTLDSDDYYYDKRKLEKEVELINKFKMEQKTEVISYSNIVVIDEDDSVLRKIYNNNYIEGDIFGEVISRSAPIPRDFIMKKEHYFACGGYDTDLKIYEDWDLKIRLAKNYKFYYTGISGTAYRHHNQGLSSINYKKHLYFLKRVFNKNYGLIEKDSGELKNKFYSYLWNIIFKNIDLDMRDKQFITDFLIDIGFLTTSKKKKCIKNKLLNIDFTKKIIIYGAGEHTENLLSDFNLDEHNVICIVDKNESLDGNKIYGINITTPAKIVDLKPDVIIISSFSYQKQIAKYIKKDLNFSGELIELYNEEDQYPYYFNQ